MQDLNIKTSIIIVGIVFLIGVALSTILFSVSSDLPVFVFPWGLKVLIELFIYFVSLFLFSNYKVKPALWVKGFAIILFFRALFSLFIGICFYILFAKPPTTYGEMFLEALIKFNYSFILQVILSPCLAYPLLIAVITEKVELERAANMPPVKARLTAPPPPPPSVELPREWAEDLEQTDKEASQGSSKNSQAISSELLKELGLSGLADDKAVVKPTAETAPKQRPEPRKPKQASINDELKDLLSGLDDKSFFSELGEKPHGKPVHSEPKPPKFADENIDLLEQLARLDPLSVPEQAAPKQPERPIKKSSEPATAPKKSPPPIKPTEEIPSIEDLDIELPAFNIPGTEEMKTPEEEGFDIDSLGLEIEVPPLVAENKPSKPAVPIEKPPVVPGPSLKNIAESKIPPESIPKKPIAEFDIPDVFAPSTEERPPLPQNEPFIEKPDLPEGMIEEIPIGDADFALPELPPEDKQDLDQFLASLSENELPAMSFQEKPIISLDDLPPLPDFPGLSTTPEAQKPQDKPAPAKSSADAKEKKPEKEKAKEKPSAKELAQKPSDTITISVRRIIDYSKNTEASAVLNKLLRRGSDYKLQVPLSMIIDQLESGTILLSADYIYNQVPIELVNFISAEQGRNLQELELIIPLGDVMQQVAPSIIMEKMNTDRPESKWTSEASNLKDTISFEEKDLK